MSSVVKKCIFLCSFVCFVDDNTRNGFKVLFKVVQIVQNGRDNGKLKMKKIMGNGTLMSPGCWTCFDWFLFNMCPTCVQNGFVATKI